MTRIRWEGPFVEAHSLARVNRELVRALQARGIEVGADERADVVVRHFWPPDWSLPADGARLIVIAPWEFGYLPRAWVEGARNAIEIWVPSRYVRDCFLRSGVPTEKVCVIPNGIDPHMFAPVPEASGAGAAELLSPAQATTRPDVVPDPFRFLFVGGTIRRKGIDVLLRAWREAALERATLVVKDVPGPYRRQNMRDEVIQAGAEYRDDDLDDATLADLYRSCHALVLPTRGEGYGLPLAEAQACGIPVITTAYGGALDFCSVKDAWLLPCRLESVPEVSLRAEDHAGVPFWAEPEVEGLVAALQVVKARPAEARHRGLHAAARMRDAWTWERAAEAAAARLEAVAARQVPTRSIIVPRDYPLAASVVLFLDDNEERMARCLEAVQSFTPLGARAELIMVGAAGNITNDSTGGEPGANRTGALAAKITGARVVQFEGAPAAAYNRGLAEAQGRVRVLLHPDALVTRGWLERLLEAFPADGTPTLVGPRSNMAGGVQKIPVTYANVRQMQRFAFDPARDAGRSERKRMETPVLDSFCLAFNAAVWDRVGPLDESLERGFFSHDYCLRARALGAEIFCAGDVFVHHDGGTDCLEHGADADRARFLRQHHPQRVVAMLRVSPPAAHLDAVVAALEAAVDEIVLLDNGAGVEMPSSVKLTGFRRQSYDPSPGTGWDLLLEMAVTRQPDWVLAVEDDEIFEERFAVALADLVHPVPETIMGYRFPVFHLWDTDHFRNEGAWRSHVPALYRFQVGMSLGDDRMPSGIAVDTISGSRIAGNTNLAAASPGIAGDTISGGAASDMAGITVSGGAASSIAGDTMSAATSPDQSSNIRDCDVRLKHLGFIEATRRPQELEATLRGGALGLSLEGAPLLERWREEVPPDHWRSLLLERVPPAAARVLVTAREPWSWGKVLHAWGKQEVVGWAPPGGDARPDELEAVFSGHLSRAALPYPDGHFDAIVLAETLVSAGKLSDLRPLLSERGCVCVAVPATPASAVEVTVDNASKNSSAAEAARAGPEGISTAISPEGVAAENAPGWTLDAVRALADGWSIARLEGARHRDTLTHYILVACAHTEAVCGLYDVPVPTLSVCLIVKNEEKVLARCLESVRGAADEIIVVDTGSSDRTVEIAHKFGAKVYHTEWTHDFATARNVSLSHATSDWILVLDADEVLDPASVPMLKKVLISGTMPDHIRMYYLREINYLLKGDLSQEASEHQNMRLFPNRPDIRYVGRIHEQVKYIGRDPDAWRTMSPGAPEPDDGTLVERFTTPLLLHHYGYISEEWDRKDRDARNLALLQKAIAETPDDPFTHFNLGCHLAHMNEAEPALKAFDRALQLLGDSTAGYAPLCYILASQVLLELGRASEGLPYTDEALRRFPNLPDAHYASGRLLAALDRVNDARAAFARAIASGGQVQGYLGSTDASTSTWKPNMELGILEMRTNRWDRALEYFTRALHYKPDMATLWANRGRCHLRLGDAARAADAFSRARALDFSDPVMLADQVDALSRLARVHEALPVARELFAATNRVSDALRLGRLLVECGHYDEALRFLENLHSNADAALLRAAASMKLGHVVEARADLEQALATYPNNPAAWNNMAAVAQASGNLAEARDCCRRAATLNPAMIEARMNLVELERLLDNDEAARSELLSLQEAFPRDPRVALFAGRTWRGMNDAARALAVLRDGVPFANDPVPLMREAAAAAVETGDSATAIGMLAEAHRRAPQDADVLLSLAQALIGTGDIQGAAEALRAVLQRVPGHPQARALLDGLREGRVESH